MESDSAAFEGGESGQAYSGGPGLGRHTRRALGKANFFGYQAAWEAAERSVEGRQDNIDAAGRMLDKAIENDYGDI